MWRRIGLVVVALALAAPSHGEVQRRALLVSLGRYPDGQTIEGAHAMADALAAQLVDRFGFQQADIRTLRDEQATKPNLFAAIDRYLVQGMDADDVAVLYYAGHGSRIQDFDDDEADGYDEVLVLWDAFEDALIDDELPPVLTRVPALDFTVILDCCHSGTGTRSGLMGDMAIKDLFVELPVKPTPKPDAQAGPPPVTVATTYTTLTACRADQTAVAISSRTKGDYLVFTKALVDSLASVALPTDYTTLLHAVRQQIVAWNIIPLGSDQVQQPQLEGPDPSRPAFASVSGKPAEPTFLDLTVACDSLALREACGDPPGGVWSDVPDDAELKVLAQLGEAWDCAIQDRNGQVIDRVRARGVADAGLWLRQALARERLIRAAARLDSARPLSLQVATDAGQMQVTVDCPAGWAMTVFQILPSGKLLVLLPSPMFKPTDGRASFVLAAPQSRALVAAVATPQPLSLPALQTNDLAPDTLRLLEANEALEFLQALAAMTQPQTRATAQWLAASAGTDLP